jgi:hypothetical protein
MSILDKVTFDLTDWNEEERSSDAMVWRNASGDVLSLTFGPFWERDKPFDRTSWLPDVRALAEPGGIISLDPFTVQSKPSMQFIYKRRRGAGHVYTGSLVVHFSDRERYVFFVVCGEGNFTGVREAIVTARLLQEGKLKPRIYRWYQKLFSRHRASGYLEGWFCDPYDPDYDGTVLCSASDSEEFDPEFPHHPLTRLRSHLKRIRESLLLLGGSQDAAPG